MKKQLEQVRHLFFVSINQLINLFVGLLFLLMIFYGSYSMWDNHQTLQVAQSSNYATYKPQKNDTLSFDELQEKNKDVFSWLTVYGTHIDYPVVQGKNNREYLNTDPTKKYQMSGSIFMDYRNQQDYSDFNSIVYGHHMAESGMFGDIDRFNDKKYFEDHQFGNLYFEGKNHGIVFFAFLNVDAFDWQIYQTPVTEQAAQDNYLQYLEQKAKHYRQMDVTRDDRLILLSTCTSNYTNGRHVLVGIITDEEIPMPQAFEKEIRRSNDNFVIRSASMLGNVKFFQEQRVTLLLLLFIILLFWYLWLVFKRKQQEKGGNHES